jgi:sulfhydrogenase subunit beta (sulfur reductase)
MASETRTIDREALARLFVQWRSEGKRILAPRQQGDHVDFAEVQTPDDVRLEQVQTVQSAKAAVFPRVEELFSFRRRDGKVELHERDLAVLPETVLFGLRPCDAAAFAALAAIFAWDGPDRLFAARLARMTVVGVACGRSDEHCFCTSVGGGPGATAGSDLLLTDLGGSEFLAEAVSERGRAIVTGAPGLFRPAAGRDKESRLARVEKAFDLDKVGPALAALFDDEGFWAEQSLRCLGCGACAYVCPTCACFDVQDEAGRRLRCWDSCGFKLFTLHTSGHNPRPLQNQRWRQRLMHKFSYMPDRQQVLGCVGCGRCSRACPVDMDILEHLRAVAEAKP